MINPHGLLCPYLILQILYFINRQRFNIRRTHIKVLHISHLTADCVKFLHCSAHMGTILERDQTPYTIHMF